jgi:hypothetical protein
MVRQRAPGVGGVDDWKADVSARTRYPTRRREPALVAAGADRGQAVNLLVMLGKAVAVVADGGAQASVVAGSVRLIAEASAGGRVASLAMRGQPC